ncbi:MAG: hypothetical protein JSW58_11315 [Candidatus Latescibacterota bacterium]|nr:MAG: hypothetical protein JSW58_11315 [Candidatus Latescibacterota bacterium]
MRLSTHYYVISLSKQTIGLFEAFRDTLIDIHNQDFPVDASARIASRAESVDQDERLREFLEVADERFGRYYGREPLIVVVTGEKELQTAFTSVTAHGRAIVGRVDGDYTTTSLHDLGRIVWPVVKEAMSGLREKALRDLEIAADAQKICGLDAVARRMNGAPCATLLVEEGYHVRGSISKADGTVTVSPNVDVRDEIDDVVDVLIEKVLETGGNVVFMPGGSLSKLDSIVLILREVEGVR